MSNRIAEGHIPSLVISGPPGMGKSWTVRKALRAADAEYDWIGGSVSAVGLYQALWGVCEGGILVLDDCDDVFRDETSLNMLKVALDSNAEREISWRKEAYWLEDMGIPNKFQFDGHVVFLTNLDFEAIIQSTRPGAGHFAALIDRSMYLCLTLRSRRDFMIRINQVCGGKNGSLQRDHKLSERDALEVLEFIEANQERFYNLSLRLAGQCAICLKADRQGWKEDIEATKMKTL